MSGSRLLGNARDLLQDQIGTYAHAMDEHGDIASLRIGVPPLGFEFDAVFAPEAARQVLAAASAHFEKDAPVISEFAYFLGNGLLVSKGEQWRAHRRIVAPLFTRRAVTEHAGAIAIAATDLVTWLDDDAEGGLPVDLYEHAMRYALDALGRAVFGDDIVDVAPVLRAELPALGDHLKRRSLSPVRSPHWFPSGPNRSAERIRRIISEIADSLIVKRRAEGTDGHDLLSRLLSARDPETGAGLSDIEVRDEAIIFLVAGHETTGSALAFTLYLLGRHPDVQDRVRAEAAATHGRGVDDLPFTTQVLFESMRLYPPAHTVVRRAIQDTEVLGYRIPKGRIVAVNIWGIHHRDSLWPDPGRFDPDRFESAHEPGERSRSTTAYSFLPFAGGPRACIGEHLAMAEMVAAVAEVVTAFRLASLQETPDVEVDLALRPRGELPCDLERISPSRRVGEHHVAVDDGESG